MLFYHSSISFDGIIFINSPFIWIPYETESLDIIIPNTPLNSPNADKNIHPLIVVKESQLCTSSCIGCIVSKNFLQDALNNCIS